MEKNYFPLGDTDERKAVRILRATFGIACIAVAGWWVDYTLGSGKFDWSLWVTVLFLVGFGLYQLLAAAGKTTRFIEFEKEAIRLKKNSLLPPDQLSSSDISRIELFPLSIVFFLKNGKKNLLRLGTVNYETNEKIVDELVRFAEDNNIAYEVKEETI